MIRRIEIVTEPWGAGLYAVYSKIDGRLMETLLSSPKYIFRARAMAAERWGQWTDEVVMGPIPDLAPNSPRSADVEPHVQFSLTDLACQ